MTFCKILIANRGEIAVRIARTAREHGYRTVAIYSDADRDSLHVRSCDEAVCIGGASPAESYLKIDAVIEAAKRTGAEAVHPGYGFLSENADFVRACEEAGLIFIGPGAEAVDLMGNKRAAKLRVAEAGVPCIPGYTAKNADDADLLANADAIGYPLMVKAAAGGGGRGMRLVEDRDQLAEAIQSARSEAAGAFGNDELILEKAVPNPRHVEIQIAADQHGHVLHLAERDCSVQRRHQKIVEEAPSSKVTPDLRERMGQAAVAVARSVHYRGLGTVEFLLDPDDHFYFMEMNTRLQVEHPVTEMITGLDLVALQLKIAQGEPLGITPDDISLIGHAMEVRLYAEDPAENFLPRTGDVSAWLPPEGEGVRVDTHLQNGARISANYDPMLAKVIAWGGDRDQSRRRLIAALHDMLLAGVITNRDYLIAILEHKVFADGEADTGFIAEYLSDYNPEPPSKRELALAASLFQYHHGKAAQHHESLRDWYSAPAPPVQMRLRYGNEITEAHLTPLVRNHYQVTIGEQQVDISIDDIETNQLRFHLDGVEISTRYAREGDQRLYLDLDGTQHIIDDLTLVPSDQMSQDGAGQLTAVMDGRIVRLEAAVGDEVKRGQTLVVMEAMKMEHRIEADSDGVVAAVHVAAGDQVAGKQLLIELTSEDS